MKYILTTDEFNKVLKDAGDKLVVVDFTAKWCGPCRMIAPFFEELEQKYPGCVFLKVDVDEASELSEERKISCMPTFHFYKQGKKVESLEGANKQKLEDLVMRLK
ncbi:thioredoxin-like [Polymixia lowei]